MRKIAFKHTHTQNQSITVTIRIFQFRRIVNASSSIRGNAILLYRTHYDFEPLKRNEFFQKNTMQKLPVDIYNYGVFNASRFSKLIHFTSIKKAVICVICRNLFYIRRRRGKRFDNAFI